MTTGFWSAVVGRDLSLPYLHVQFSLINAPGPGGGRPYLVGSFTDWLIDPRYQMQWDESSRVYFLDLLIKEEEIFYAYYWDDPGLLPSESKFQGPSEVSFTAFVYARDARYPTARLLAIKSDRVTEGSR